MSENRKLKPFDLSSVVDGDRPSTQDEMMLGKSNVEMQPKASNNSNENLVLTNRLVTKLSQDWLDKIGELVKSGKYPSGNKFILEAIAQKCIDEGLISEEETYAKKILATKQ